MVQPHVPPEGCYSHPPFLTNRSLGASEAAPCVTALPLSPAPRTSESLRQAPDARSTRVPGASPGCPPRGSAVPPGFREVLRSADSSAEGVFLGPRIAAARPHLLGQSASSDREFLQGKRRWRSANPAAFGVVDGDPSLTCFGSTRSRTERHQVMALCR